MFSCAGVAHHELERGSVITTIIADNIVTQQHRKRALDVLAHGSKSDRE